MNQDRNTQFSNVSGSAEGEGSDYSHLLETWVKAEKYSSEL